MQFIRAAFCGVAGCAPRRSGGEPPWRHGSQPDEDKLGGRSPIRRGPVDSCWPRSRGHDPKAPTATASLCATRRAARRTRLRDPRGIARERTRRSAPETLRSLIEFCREIADFSCRRGPRLPTIRGTPWPPVLDAEGCERVRSAVLTQGHPAHLARDRVGGYAVRGRVARTTARAPGPAFERGRRDPFFRALTRWLPPHFQPWRGTSTSRWTCIPEFSGRHERGRGAATPCCGVAGTVLMNGRAMRPPTVSSSRDGPCRGDAAEIACTIQARTKFATVSGRRDCDPLRDLRYISRLSTPVLPPEGRS